MQEISLILGGLAASQFLSEQLDEKPIRTWQAKVLSHNHKVSYQQQTSVTTELTLSLGYTSMALGLWLEKKKSKP